MERTLIIIKPDALKRGLVGKIIETFENVGLKLMAAKMLRPDKRVIKNHYPGAKEWIREMGEKTLSSFKQSGVNVKEKMETDDPDKLGQFVYDRLIKYWMEGPIIVMVWQGPDAIQIARKLRGHTIPLLAQTGTLHSDYSFDSSTLSSSLDRVVKTFVHASGNKEEAEREIKYWFGKTDFKSYEREIDELYLK
ncbi:nucleoside-diphosphate kinase [Candidatus Roizmanbacteria bacterium CG02_land_8_20_14_3_00_36_15]|uniref:nucleoside-diphosphate kinase n=2 Tax=Candidatus Roizmaniibacteriota TaxID=1752723 RepID=A0A2M8KLZ4_9BACT|nr:MAG: nucleoside-diphosphate kinase [Candidatus Roizmanbacteria bacterium CG03_land_8_20_14_0_80_36_21]PIV37968.1 MAG: nucleoside-diphosphate kinase [Candidatus Roizmanbacteria bacterium CG02_land_8_20_14_3_00_36_15]PIY69969.1 MAG: nucleoside-diphosphate kinase [Candidatus Roizmanbacteria bacterium CG_4_10_14_0_8_um_filter_36_36]PJA52554.1 MAG: nucleoside-diphosphate kinase [Candidatus Roizmanbacteria bacterium CG_4_9_14_3_um_filter_36_11]PJC81993.1 MAG: nucleoside-diphosphate kinase [Candida